MSQNKDLNTLVEEYEYVEAPDEDFCNLTANSDLWENEE